MNTTMLKDTKYISTIQLYSSNIKYTNKELFEEFKESLQYDNTKDYIFIRQEDFTVKVYAII
jgi:hypothetical protein